MTTAPNRRRNLWLAQLGACAYCTRVYDSECRGTIDHIIPRSRGGSNARENMAWACRQCNHAKRDMLPDDPRWLKTKAKLKALAETLRGSHFKTNGDRLQDRDNRGQGRG